MQRFQWPLVRIQKTTVLVCCNGLESGTWSRQTPPQSAGSDTNHAFTARFKISHCLVMRWHFVVFFCVISFIVIQSFCENLPIMFLLCQFKLFQDYFSSEVNQRSLVTLSLSILAKSTHPTTTSPSPPHLSFSVCFSTMAQPWWDLAAYR